MRLFILSLKELVANRRFCILFILNLSLGLAGLLALDGFKVALDQKVKGQSKAVLGADFAISARRPILDEESRLVEKLVQQKFQKQEMVETFSMVANKGRRSRLVQIKAVERGFPFYGQIDLLNYGTVDENAFDTLYNQNGVWIYPELQSQLSLSVGDSLFIGNLTFFVTGIIKSDAASGITTNMAPRIYMSRQAIEQTGLLGQGSIAWHSVIYQIPNQSSSDLAKLREKVFEKITSADLKVMTHENASANTTLLISRLNDFLGLTSLVGLFLAAVGATFLFRSYFQSKTRQVATLMALGASRTKAFTYYLNQLAMLGLASALLASFLASFFVPFFTRITQDFLPFEVSYSLQWPTLWVGLLLGLVGSVLIALPVLVGLNNIRPAQLLTGDRQDIKGFQLLSLLASLPGLLFFWGLTIWFSRSYFIGSFFTFAILVSTFILSIVSLLLFHSMTRFFKSHNLALRWALRDLSRNRTMTVVCFVCIGLGSLLLNLIPQVQESLSTELQQPERSKVPSLFLFDIQEDQVDRLKQIAVEEKAQIDQLSPTIQARLMTVNGKSFDKGKGESAQFSREQENEMRFRNRGFNLSYRAELSDSESLVEGREFSGPYSGEGVAEISLEARFAKRLGLAIGDTLVFDVEGVEISGQVVNLRSVRWASFQPNFFVQFQPGVLDLAPKTFIATLPPLSLDNKLSLQDKLVEALPNVSMIDISRIVEQLSKIIEQMSLALVLMSALCLFAGFIVIFTIANHQADQRKWDIGLLKAVGASFPQIRNSLVWQYTLIGSFATFWGGLLSLIFSYILSYYLFDGLWAFNWKVPLASFAIGTAITYIVSEVATRRALSMKAKDLFSS